MQIWSVYNVSERHLQVPQSLVGLAISFLLASHKLVGVSPWLSPDCEEVAEYEEMSLA